MGEEMKCVRCGGALEAGFVPDRDYGMPTKPSEWVEGEAVSKFWTGLQVDGRRQYKVVTFRCVGCGHLESFAREPVE